MSEIHQGRRAITFIITGSFANLHISTIFSDVSGFRHRYTGLGTQIKENISLIQILEDKISIAIVSNIVRNLTLRYPCFFVFSFLKKS